jgi:2-iminobutanoate/2-iminopropanoate deaminase
MSPLKQVLSSDRLAPAVGPYSQAVRSRKIVAGGLAEQTRRVLDNLTLLLDDCGSSRDHVLKTTVFLQDMEHFAEFNALYAEYFPFDPPARSTVQAARLPLDALIEVEAIAVIP